MMKLFIRKKKFIHGFSIVEVIIGMTILVIGIIPLFTVLGDVRRGVTVKESQINASIVAQSYLSLLQSKKWDESAPDVGVYSNVRTSSLGREAETSVDQYNDIDDFNGTSVDLDSHTRISFVVNYVSLTRNGTMTISGIPTDYKSVEMTIDVTGQHPVSTKLTSVFSNSNWKNFQ